MTLIRCCTCRQELPIEAFTPSRLNRRAKQCRECRNGQQRARRPNWPTEKYYNREKINATRRARRATDPEKYREKDRERYRACWTKGTISWELMLARCRAYRIANRDQINARRRARHAANPEYINKLKRAARAAKLEHYRERERAWNVANREKLRELERVRRAANPELRRYKDRVRRESNPEKYKERARVKRVISRERCNIQKQEYRKLHREEINKKQNEYRAKARFALKALRQLDRDTGGALRKMGIEI